jgi:hypothetical protein
MTLLSRSRRCRDNPTAVRLLRVAVLAGAVVSGCGGQSSLGQASISSDCAPDDVRCVALGFTAPIAVGGTSTVRVSSLFRGAGVPSFELASANPAVLGVSGDRVTGVTPGVSALMVLVPGAGGDPAEPLRVLDFMHLFIETPDRIGLGRLTDSGGAADLLEGALDMVVGDELRVRLTPVKRELPLVGTDDGTWTLAGDALALLRDGQPGRRRLVARAPGSATLTVSGFGLTTTLAVEVAP